MNRSKTLASLAVAALLLCVWQSVQAATERVAEDAGGQDRHSRPVDSDAPESAAAAKTPVLKKALGIMTAGHTFYPIIPANQSLPFTYSDTFANAKDNQTVIDIHLVQQDDRGQEKILDARLGNLPPRPMGKLKLTIQVKVDRKKNLTFRANLPENGYYAEFGPFHLDRPDSRTTTKQHDSAPVVQPRTVESATSGAASPETAQAQLNRALDRYTGVGGPVDKAAARSLFAKACEGGLVQACYNLGVMKDQGEAGPVDKAGARKLYQVACDNGSANGCFNLALMNNRGEGGPVDRAAARTLYQKACDGDVAKGCSNLGDMKQHGRGGPTDMVAARRLFGTACRGGLAIGCFNLAVMTEQGKGGPVDQVASRALRKQACEGGYKPACSGN